MKKWLFNLAVISIPFAEVAFTLFLSRRVGAVQTYTLFAVPTAIGLVLAWVRWRREIRPWSQRLRQASEERKTKRRHKMTGDEFRFGLISVYFWIGVILLLFPGFLTDAVALLLMLPGVRERMLPEIADPDVEIRIGTSPQAE